MSEMIRVSIFEIGVGQKFGYGLALAKDLGGLSRSL